MTEDGRPDDRERLGSLAVTAVGFAVWTGLAEEIPAFLAPVGGAVVRLSRDFVWMTPLSHGLFFFLVSLALLGLSRYWGNVLSRPVVIGVFSGSSALALGLFLERIHPAAILVMAIGVGTQVSRMTRPHLPRRRMAPVLAVLGLAAVLGLTARKEWAEWSARRHRMAIQPSPSPDAPNIILLILDTVRGISLDFLNPDGSASEWRAVHAQGLTELAGKSRVFTNAFAPAPWTLPSHASMFTGRWPNELTGGRQLSAGSMGKLGPEYPTVAEVLTRNGYHTGGFVGNLIFTSAETGLSRGFLWYEDYTVSLSQVVLSSALGRALSEIGLWRRIVGYHDTLNRKNASTVTDQFLRWQARQGERPFFAFINFFDAHEPFFPPDSIKRSLPRGAKHDDFSHMVGFLTGATAWRTKKWTMTDAERTAYAAGYHESILRTDREIQRIVRELDARGALENTILIVTSDHGEQLGEHELFNHNNSLYLPLLHVPLLIFDPRSPELAGTVDDIVSTRHLAATVLEFAGMNDERAGIQGASLSRYWAPPEGETNEVTPVAPDTVFALLHQGAVDRPWYPVGRGPVMFSLADSIFHYVLNGDGTEELYDHRADPRELTNLSGNFEFFSNILAFRTTLRALLGNPPAGIVN